MNIDALIADIYAASNGRRDWSAVLTSVANALDCWTVQVLGVDKRRGHLLFSNHGGRASPQTALDYFRTYNSIDPRVPLALSVPTGQWIHCHEHFDDDYVAASPFYQDFLIPHGGRYVSGAVLIDDADVGFIVGFMRGGDDRPIQPEQMPALESLRYHFAEAMRNVMHLRATYAELGMARQLLDQFDHPMMLIDETRGIWHRNAAADAMLARGEFVSDQHGLLVFQDRANDHALAEGVFSLDLTNIDPHAPQHRRAVRLRKPDGSPCLALLSAARPAQTMGAFGHTARAIVILHDPCAPQAGLDPFIVAECFDLTPAEARVAVLIAGGANAKEIARKQGLSVATVRTQIAQVLEKANVNRQADLIRVLMTLPIKAAS